MKHNFNKISRHFQLQGTLLTCDPYGSGHINETFLLKTREQTSPDYILQRINNTIFTDIHGLMENIRKVTSHLHDKLIETGRGNPEKEILTLIPTIEDKAYLIDEYGNYWRMYLYIWPNKSYDIVPDGKIAFEGGKMFGRFQKLLSDLPGDELVETIPDFHNIERRLETFYQILHDDKFNRAAGVKDEIQFVENHHMDMRTILQLGRDGQIPKRVTHNDTKFNNVLLDENNRGLCVIDLDTVMPGYIHYDFGDTIRTATNTGAEDEPDLSKVEMDIDIFNGFAQGFLSETKEILSKIEIDHLVFSGRLLTYTIGLRFLTDYLNGDSYFRTHRSDHNIERCRAQFKLFQSQLRQEEQMIGIIKSITV